MPSRNCKTRPLSWRIARNGALAEAVKAVGWEASWVFVNIIASVDNIGRMEGGRYQLRDMFFPHVPSTTPEQVSEYVVGLATRGLIIHYPVNKIWYIQLPKIGNFSKIRGGMTTDSDFPPPPAHCIEQWTQDFSDVYTPCIQHSHVVSPEDKDKGKDQDKDYTTYVGSWNSKMKWQIKTVTGKRKEHLKARLKDTFFRDHYDQLLDKILQSDFLLGEKPSKTYPNFRADFDWIIANDTNYVKVLEGKYDDKSRGRGD